MQCYQHMPTSFEENARADGQPPAEADAADTISIPLQRHSPVNVLLIIGSVLVSVWAGTLWGGQDPNIERLTPWLISLFPANAPERLIEVRHGEIWRLLTPAFLHFSVAHLGFNMLNMVTLGNILERRICSRHYLLFTLSIALFSNLGQYFSSDNVLFGGMSGVVYGLFGYVWLRGKYDPTFGLAMPRQTIIMALIWFVACFTGVLGHIANVAHAIGLALGALWGILDARIAMRHFRQSGNIAF